MSDRVSARCQGCSATLGVPLYAAGKRIRCPKCQAVVDVPIDAEILDPGPDAEVKKNPESSAPNKPLRPERPLQRGQSPRLSESGKGASASRSASSSVRRSRTSKADEAPEVSNRRSSNSSTAERADARGMQQSKTSGRQSPQGSESSRKRRKADNAEDTYGNELDFIADYADSSGHDNPFATSSLPPRQKNSSKSSRSTTGSNGFGDAVDGSVSGQMLIGIAMMVGAVAWFVGGLMMLDRIFIYPPVLFILGAIACGKGMIRGFQRPSTVSNAAQLTTGERVVRLVAFLPTFLIVKLFVVAFLIRQRRGPVGLIEFAIAGGLAGATAVMFAKFALVIYRMIKKRGAS